MRVLILYSTTEGQTRKICRFVADQVQEAGHQYSLHDLTDDPVTPEGYQAVVIGSSIHIGKYQTSAMQYIKDHAEELNRVPSAFLSVSLTAASDTDEGKEEMEKITDHFLKFVGWEPGLVKQVAGALKYTQYDFFKRYIMRNISKKEGRTVDTSQDHEFTDWDDLKTTISDFLTKAAS